jgi:hypothetical protein
MSAGRIMTRCSFVPAIFAAAVLVLLISACTSQAGILLPQQIGFDAKDLARSLSDNQASGSTAQHDTSQFPRGEQDQQPGPLGLLKGSFPMSHSSSSSSSSSGGGVAGASAALCLANSAITNEDDSSIGRLTENHGLSLPDPPGTDLLRPPRPH